PPAGSPQLPDLFERPRAPDHGPSLTTAGRGGVRRPRAGTYIAPSPRTRVQMPFATECSHLGRGVPGFDLEHESVHRHHPDGAALRHRVPPAGAGPPGRPPDGHHTVGIEVGAGLSELADHRVATHGRDREPVPHGHRHAAEHEHDLPDEDQPHEPERHGEFRRAGEELERTGQEGDGATPVQKPWCPAWTSTAKPNVDTTNRARATSLTGRWDEP